MDSGEEPSDSLIMAPIEESQMGAPGESSLMVAPEESSLMESSLMAGPSQRHITFSDSHRYSKTGTSQRRLTVSPSKRVIPSRKSLSMSASRKSLSKSASRKKFKTAFEEYGHAEFAPHTYGFGRLIWKTVAVEELIVYSQDLIRAPLLRRLAGGPLKHRAVSVFAHLRAYMEDIPVESQNACHTLMGKCHGAFSVVQSPVENIQQILNLGIRYEELRDEIFCQICKQTTRNPDRESNMKGWKAMAICVGIFPPSKLFKVVLEEHLKQVYDGRALTSFDETSDDGATDAEDLWNPQRAALYCLARLEKISNAGARDWPPLEDEITAIEKMEGIETTICLPSGDAQVISVDSMATAREVTEEIVTSLGLSDDSDLYGIFEVVDGVEKYVGAKSYLMDVRAKWSKNELPKLEGEFDVIDRARNFIVTHIARCAYILDTDGIITRQISDAYERKETDELEQDAADEDAGPSPSYSTAQFLFKKRMFLPVDILDPARNDFFYAQANYDVVHGLYKLEETNAVMLAALHLRADVGYGYTNPEDHLTAETVGNYGPQQYVKGYEQVWKRAILKNFAALPVEQDMYVCRSDYLEFLRSRTPVYASSWFYVEQRSYPRLPEAVYIALNPSGLYIVDVGSKEILIHMHYNDICSWGHSVSAFSLVSGNMTRNREFRFLTRQAEEISDVVQYYINALLLE